MTTAQHKERTQERFDKALATANDALGDGPTALGSVLYRADYDANGSDDIREIAVFCGALAAEMQDGENRAYLTRLQAVMEEYAEAWAGNE